MIPSRDLTDCYERISPKKWKSLSSFQNEKREKQEVKPSIYVIRNKNASKKNQTLIGVTERQLSKRMREYLTRCPKTFFAKKIKRSPDEFEVGVMTENPSLQKLQPSTVEKIGTLLFPEKKDLKNQRLGGGGGSKNTKKEATEKSPEHEKFIEEIFTTSPKKKYPFTHDPETKKISVKLTPTGKELPQVIYAIRKNEEGNKTYYLGKTEPPCKKRLSSHLSNLNRQEHVLPFYQEILKSSEEGTLQNWEFCLFTSQKDFEEKSLSHEFDLSSLEKAGLTHLKAKYPVYNQNNGGGGGVSRPKESKDVVEQVLNETFSDFPHIVRYLISKLFPNKNSVKNKLNF